MADDNDAYEGSHAESESRKSSRSGKVSSKERSKKNGYPRKGRRRDDESPPPSPRELRRDDGTMSSFEILSPTGTILHQQEAMHRGQPLDWNFNVNLSAEKVPDPAIYTCEKCNLPILIYGRLIPCKHVFCFNCAKNSTEKFCPRCKDPFTRIEQSALGTVFICTFGGGKQTPKGCKRTYLSPRDLNAHIAHRHKQKPSSTSGHASSESSAPKSATSSSSHPMSSLPDIDLSDLSNITDAQLKAAAEILSATMNAGKASNSQPDHPPSQHPQQQQHHHQPEALLPPAQPQNYVNSQHLPTPHMNPQPQPSMAGVDSYNPPGMATYQPPPHTVGYHHNPAPQPMNIMSPMGGSSGHYYPHPGGPPPMSGPPPTGPPPTGPPPMLSGPPTSNYGGPPQMSRGMNQQLPYGK